MEMNASAAADLPTLILVEDNEDDEMLILRTVARSSWQGNVQVARDGVEARTLFDETSGHSPELILMDLALPQVEGFELLDRVRSRVPFLRTPLVIFATSPSEEQVEGCYAHGANAVVVKPLGFEEVTSAVDCIVTFWLQCNRRSNLRRSAQEAAPPFSPITHTM